MNKIQEAFEKKYLVSAFSQKEIDLFMKTFTAGYKAKEAETCEWKHVKDFFHNFYITGCCGTQVFRNGIGENTYTYCPYCGGKIVEKEK